MRRVLPLSASPRSDGSFPTRRPRRPCRYAGRWRACGRPVTRGQSSPTSRHPPATSRVGSMNGPISSQTLAAVLRFHLRSAWYDVGRAVRTSDSRTWGGRLGPVDVAGHQLILRSPRLGDAAQWREVRLREQAHIERWWTTSPLSWAERHTDVQWVSYVLEARRQARAKRALPLVIELDGQLAGQCNLEGIDPVAGIGEMGIWMDSTWARQRVATVAAGLVVDHAVTELGLHRITAPICEGNIAAAWGARRLGMLREGVMEGFLNVGGARQNHHLWAITANRIPPGGLASAMLEAASRVHRRQPASVSPVSRRRPQVTPADANGAIRVVIQNGEYWLCNHGDAAMLEVTIRRLRERWPDARIGVLTSAPNLLRAVEPGAEPISDRGTGDWPVTGVTARLAQRVGARVVGPAAIGRLTAMDLLGQYSGRLDQALRRVVGVGLPRRQVVPQDVPAALRNASLVLAMGGGYFADVDPEQAHRTLDLLEHAGDRGIPAVMVGQGLGPLEDATLVARAARVLPQLDFIALREGLQGPELLSRLGVAVERTSVTGDDAVELGYEARQEQVGSDLGVCLRIADYSPVATQTKETVGRVVRRIAGEVGAGLVPLIISEYRSEDRRATLPLVEGFANIVPPPGRYVTPRGVAARVSRCRVLVTGAYHLGVFALSQGIPVVGLTSSRYYDGKFLGLRDMFGGGVHLVRLDEPDLDERISSAIHGAWSEATDVRRLLRERALAQIDTSKQGFERVFDIVETRHLVGGADGHPASVGRRARVGETNETPAATDDSVAVATRQPC
ncbi:MAG: GNAT family N-acetyltransferase [Pseudonocardiaceae bacterium]|nr:GNAT family N-acetyltransferase [Pseudonocardiaceae bacterium]